MNLRQAAEIALEALDSDNPDIQLRAALALRQALAQSEQEPPPWWATVEKILEEYGLQAMDFVADFKKAMGQPEQEPVEYKEECWACGCEECICAQSALGYFAPQKQEPVAWANADDLQNFDMRVRTNCDLMHTVPLYTAPPKREWVGLTDEEGAEIWADAHDIDRNRLVTPKEIVRRIEAKLKEKNT